MTDPEPCYARDAPCTIEIRYHHSGCHSSDSNKNTGDVIHLQLIDDPYNTVIKYH